MTEETHKILLASDSVEGGFELPFTHTHEGWKEIWQRIGVVKRDIEQLIGEGLKSDNSVQDATFFEQLGVYSEKPGKGGSAVLSAQMAIVFSNFGNLVTIWSVDPKSLERYPVNSIKSILEQNGFTYIPRGELNAEYDRRYATRNKIKWVDRFFTYM